MRELFSHEYILLTKKMDRRIEESYDDFINNYPPPKGVVLAKRPYKGLDWGSKLKGIDF